MTLAAHSQPLADALQAIDDNIDEATMYGHGAAVDALTASLATITTSLAPLVEVLSHPENREHLARFRGWLRDNGPSTTEPPAEVRALLGLLDAVEVL